MAETATVYRGDLQRFLRRISDVTEVDFGLYRDAYVERRVSARMRSLDIHTYRQYSSYLESHPEERSLLLETVTINVTDFFRDSAVYDIFRSRVIPDLIAQKKSSHQHLIRVWSAGCASGEEPCSITMSLLDVLGREARDFAITVVATDIDEAVLRKAKRAEYPMSQLAQLPADTRERYVEHLGTTFRINADVTRHIKFRCLNLFDDSPIQPVDVIFCRNVFIYFKRCEQERVLNRFWSALHRGGYLILGRSEKMPSSLASRFELVDGRYRVYRRAKNEELQ